MSAGSGFAGERGGALVRVERLGVAAHTDEVICRARRAVALQTLRGLPIEEVPTILEILGIDRTP